MGESDEALKYLQEALPVFEDIGAEIHIIKLKI
jgi:hypothetical protein